MSNSHDRPPAPGRFTAVYPRRTSRSRICSYAKQSQRPLPRPTTLNECEGRLRRIPLIFDDYLCFTLSTNDACIACVNPRRQKQNEVEKSYRSERDVFLRKYESMDSADLSSLMRIHLDDLIQSFGDFFKCVFCYKAFSVLLMDLNKLKLNWPDFAQFQDHPDPLRVLTPFVIGDREILIDPVHLPKSKSMADLFCIRLARLKEEVSTTEACKIHDGNSNAYGGKLQVWSDVWAILEAPTRRAVLEIPYSLIVSYISEIVGRHSFCERCEIHIYKSILYLFEIRSDDYDIFSDEDEEADPIIFDYLNTCGKSAQLPYNHKNFSRKDLPHFKSFLTASHHYHIHVEDSEKFVRQLMYLIHPEIDPKVPLVRRTASNILGGQNCFLLAIGLLLFRRFQGIRDKYRDAKFSVNALAYTLLTLMKRSFDHAYEQKRGLADVDEICKEMEGQKKESKSSRKRAKKKRNKKNLEEEELNDENNQNSGNINESVDNSPVVIIEIAALDKSAKIEEKAPSKIQGFEDKKTPSPTKGTSNGGSEDNLNASKKLSQQEKPLSEPIKPSSNPESKEAHQKDIDEKSQVKKVFSQKKDNIDHTSQSQETLKKPTECLSLKDKVVKSRTEPNEYSSSRNASTETEPIEASLQKENNLESKEDSNENSPKSKPGSTLSHIEETIDSPSTNKEVSNNESVLMQSSSQVEEDTVKNKPDPLESSTRSKKPVKHKPPPKKSRKKKIIKSKPRPEKAVEKQPDPVESFISKEENLDTKPESIESHNGNINESNINSTDSSFSKEAILEKSSELKEHPESITRETPSLQEKHPLNNKSPDPLTHLMDPLQAFSILSLNESLFSSELDDESDKYGIPEEDIRSFQESVPDFISKRKELRQSLRIKFEELCKSNMAKS